MPRGRHWGRTMVVLHPFRVKAQWLLRSPGTGLAKCCGAAFDLTKSVMSKRARSPDEPTSTWVDLRTAPHSAPHPIHPPWSAQVLADARKATEEAIAAEAKAADSKREAEARWV